VVQGRGRPRFSLETLHGLRVFAILVGEKLEGDGAAELAVLGA
jgi:hypothetical protein